MNLDAQPAGVREGLLRAHVDGKVYQDRAGRGTLGQFRVRYVPAMSRSTFRCISGCAGEYALDEIIYKCPVCGDLLEVVHDMEALKTRSAASWIKLFDERYLRTSWPYGSGVWGKKEWVQPHVRDENVVSMLEGGTNLLWAERYGRELGLGDLWVKQCGVSHTGSFKDLGMTVLVSTVKQMIADGKPLRAVACASTGDTSAALAAYAAAAGIRAMVILPRGKVSTAQLVQPLANGAIVLAVDGDFDDCMAMVKRLAEEEGVYLANSMNSLRIEGQKTVAIEMVQQFDWEVPDWVVIPGGNLGNVSALGAGFLMMKELGLIRNSPASAWRRPRRRTRSTAPTRPAGTRSRQSRRGRPSPRRSRSATRSASRRRSEPWRNSKASSRKRPRPSWPTPPHAPIERGSSTARTPASRWRRWRS